MDTTASPAKRPLSLGVIFLTLYIDLVGFSIIFPLFPDILRHYLATEADSGLLAALVHACDSFAHLLGRNDAFTEVLFGGVLSSIYAFLQFVFAPMWGALSDRVGRRHVLFATVGGTTFSYVLWALSGSFWLFIVSRLIAGAFSGNISVATAAVADVTSREERSRAMGIVGAAFGLGLVTGPGIGAATAHINLVAHFPGLARFGFNPFSVPALLSLLMSTINLLWIGARFRETLPAEARARGALRPAERVRHPLKAIFALGHAGVRLTNLVGFFQALAFCAMEFSLTFLGVERFGYTARQNGYLMIFLGCFSIITQGMIVRRLLKRMPEIRVLRAGLVLTAVALVIIGFSARPWQLYVGLALIAIGSGFVNPAASGLISLYAPADQQGRVLGIFRSLSSLARAVTPIVAGVLFFILGASVVFSVAAVVSATAFLFAARLPAPEK